MSLAHTMEVRIVTKKLILDLEALRLLKASAEEANARKAAEEAALQAAVKAAVLAAQEAAEAQRKAELEASLAAEAAKFTVEAVKKSFALRQMMPYVLSLENLDREVEARRNTVRELTASVNEAQSLVRWLKANSPETNISGYEDAIAASRREMATQGQLLHRAYSKAQVAIESITALGGTPVGSTFEILRRRAKDKEEMELAAELAAEIQAAEADARAAKAAAAEARRAAELAERQAIAKRMGTPPVWTVADAVTKKNR